MSDRHEKAKVAADFLMSLYGEVGSLDVEEVERELGRRMAMRRDRVDVHRSNSVSQPDVYHMRLLCERGTRGWHSDFMVTRHLILHSRTVLPDACAELGRRIDWAIREDAIQTTTTRLDLAARAARR